MESLDDQIARQRMLITTMDQHFEKQLKNLQAQIDRRKAAIQPPAPEKPVSKPIQHQQNKKPLISPQTIVRPKGKK